MRSVRSVLATRRSTFVALGLSAAGAFVGVTWLSHDGTPLAQDAVEQAEPAPHAPKKAPPKPARKVEKPAPAAPAPAAPTPAAATAAPPAQDLAAKLKENGAGTCGTQINALAADAMGGVNQFNTASNWANASPNKRLVGLSVGQKYPDGNNVPYGATNIVAAPNPQGSCDAFAFQVLPSPLSCAKLRESLMTNGRQIGDLAGLPLMQDAGGQTMLIPAPGNTCVLLGIKAAYAK